MTRAPRLPANLDPRVGELIAAVIVPALLERFLREHSDADAGDRLRPQPTCIESAP